jgi:hypothetical protein
MRARKREHTTCATGSRLGMMLKKVYKKAPKISICYIADADARCRHRHADAQHDVDVDVASRALHKHKRQTHALHTQKHIFFL